jgi:hypothetical protein
MKRTFYIVCFITLLSIVGCELDHGLGPMESRIKGRIVFLNFEHRPDYVESVRIIAVVKWDPDNLSMSDVVIANRSVNLSREYSEYDVSAPVTTYDLVAAIWKQKGKAWNYTNVLGFYGFDPVTFELGDTRVRLTKEHPVVADIDIRCDWLSIQPQPD